jgi:hypothetical protein
LRARGARRIGFGECAGTVLPLVRRSSGGRGQRLVHAHRRTHARAASRPLVTRCSAKNGSARRARGTAAA